MAKTKIEPETLGLILIVIGIGIMVASIGIAGMPYSIVKVGPVEVSEVNPPSAMGLAVGAIIFLTGIGVYLGSKRK